MTPVMELDLIRTVAPAGGQRSKPLLIGVSRNRLKSLLSIEDIPSHGSAPGHAATVVSTLDVLRAVF